MKAQSENLQKEFDKVTEELAKLQKQVVSGGDTKKDDWSICLRIVIY